MESFVEEEKASWSGPTAGDVVRGEHVCDEFPSGSLLCPSWLHLQGKIDWCVCILHINTMKEQPVSRSVPQEIKILLLPANQINQDALGNKK